MSFVDKYEKGEGMDANSLGGLWRSGLSSIVVPPWNTLLISERLQLFLFPQIIHRESSPLYQCTRYLTISFHSLERINSSLSPPFISRILFYFLLRAPRRLLFYPLDPPDFLNRSTSLCFILLSLPSSQLSPASSFVISTVRVDWP